MSSHDTVSVRIGIEWEFPEQLYTRSVARFKRRLNIFYVNVWLCKNRLATLGGHIVVATEVSRCRIRELLSLMGLSGWNFDVETQPLSH